MADSQEEPQIRNGKLLAARVTDKVTSKVEKGQMSIIAGIIVHQTGGANAQSALASYEKGAAGAHFLIDMDGTIYQTARTNQKCWHVLHKSGTGSASPSSRTIRAIAGESSRPSS